MIKGYLKTIRYCFSGIGGLSQIGIYRESK
nr:MAG TPA: Putative ribose 5-phosphate isomerase [Caudoviricetes sp.]